MSFFHFHEPLGFLNSANDPYDPFGTRDKQYFSTSEKVSGLLYAVTYWGDYGGDSISRYHFDTVLENAGQLVTVVDGAYGKGLVLTHVYYGSDALAPDTRTYFRDKINWLKEFMAWAANAPSYPGMTRADYPVFDESDWSEWEFEKTQEILEEDIAGWLGSDVRSQFSSYSGLADSDLEFSDEDILAAIGTLYENRGEYPSFETAVDIHMPFDSQDIAMQLLEDYAGALNPSQPEQLF